MNYNSYQLRVKETLLSTLKNIVVNAKAGTGKTTLLKMLCHAIDPNLRVLFAAFNKSIVTELKEKLPDTVECSTLHSKGFQIVRSSISNGRCKVEAGKIRRIVKEMSSGWNLEAAYDDKEEIKKYCDRVVKLADLARLFLTKNAGELESVAEKYDILISNGEIKKTFEVLSYSGKIRKKVDFTDMIYHAVRYGDFKESEKYDLIFIDEAQDLNKVQQAMVFKLLKDTGRFVAVGDPSQSIYGFAGADSDSFLNFVNRPNTVELPLNECYRCGKNIIKLAQSIVPEIEAWEGKEDGTVNLDAELSEINEESFVMCRNTKPLVSLFYLLLRMNIPSHIVGRDMAKRIVSTIEKTKASGLEPMFNELQKQLKKIMVRLSRKYTDASEEQLKQKSQYRNFEEMIGILEVIADSDSAVKSAQDLRSKVYEMFDEKNGGAMLSTIHRAKGLEAEKCFIVRPDLMPSKWAKQDWEMQQEENLRYVAYTRAKSYLGIINFEEL